MQSEGTARATVLGQAPPVACGWDPQIPQDLVSRGRGLSAKLK